MLDHCAILHKKRKVFFHPFKTKPMSVLCTLASHVPEAFFPQKKKKKRQKDAFIVTYANDTW